MRSDMKLGSWLCFLEVTPGSNPFESLLFNWGSLKNKQRRINKQTISFNSQLVEFNSMKTLGQLFVEGSSFCRFGLRHVALHRYTKGPILEHNHIHTTNVKDRHGCLYQHVDRSTKSATGITGIM